MAAGITKLLSIAKLGRVAYGNYKWRILVLAILGFVSGLLEALGVNALIPLFSFAFGQQGGQDFISRQMEKGFNVFHVPFSVNSLLVFIILLFVFKSLFTLLLNYLRVKVVSDYEIRTRSGLFQSVLTANWTYLLRQKLGHLESVLMVDISSSANLFSQISNTLIMVVSLTVYLLVAINISAPITVLTLVLGAILFFALRPLMAKVKGVAARRSKLYKDIAHLVNENTVGMKTVKTMSISDSVIQKGREKFLDWQALTIKTSMLKNVGTSLIQPFGIIFIVVIFGLTYRTAEFNPAALAAIVYLIERMFLYVGQLQGALHSVNDLVPHLQNVLRYQEIAEKNREIDSGGKPFVMVDKLKFNNLSFFYQNKSRTKVLKNVSFEIRKGESVGLIGPSGVGKTTLVDLILRLFEPTAGQIFLDGMQIQQISLDSWRKHIGYVSQDIFLINETIRNNIRFFDQSTSEQDIAEAARQANIFEFIQTLPDKFDTLVGERGVLLSAGQKQRIVIARVLARKPQILILDEATSALDNESERLIWEAISKLKNKVTVLVIAHRLSTLSDVDRLIVLHDAQIKEQGKPADLLADHQSYFFRISNMKGVVP